MRLQKNEGNGNDIVDLLRIDGAGSLELGENGALTMNDYSGLYDHNSTVTFEYGDRDPIKESVPDGTSLGSDIWPADPVRLVIPLKAGTQEKMAAEPLLLPIQQ